MKKLITLTLSLMLTIPMMGQLIINEVLYDPSNNALDGDANGDGVYSQEDDSFIEFVNIGTTNFDASGYQLWDDTINGSLRFVVPQGTWVPPNGALVIFGGGTLVGNFGGCVIFKTDSVDGWNPNNSGEVIVVKDNNGRTVLTFDSDALSNNPNESYTRFPDITGNFLQHGDTTSVLFSPGTRTDGTPFDTNYVVMSIAVSGAGGASTITVDGGTLQMEAMVMPTFAADTTVTWSVDDPAVGTISATGLLTAVSDGTVNVIATANDGTGIADTLAVTISNQSIGIDEQNLNALNIYPNPATDFVNIEVEGEINSVSIYTLEGRLVMQSNEVENGVSVNNLTAGVYILRAEVNGTAVESRFIKK
ncbi:MAG: Ig-like domain-containing protein [Flavobacteriia bacterium]|nr:Ig-like domain-containing protein [Flavobacteriia bacterium]